MHAFLAAKESHSCIWVGNHFHYCSQLWVHLEAGWWIHEFKEKLKPRGSQYCIEHNSLGSSLFMGDTENRVQAWKIRASYRKVLSIHRLEFYQQTFSCRWGFFINWWWREKRLKKFSLATVGKKAQTESSINTYFKEQMKVYWF